MIDRVDQKARPANGDTVEQAEKAGDYDHVDPVQLSVYGHRLMGIAEQVRRPIRWGDKDYGSLQMGDILRKISISLNIKERLD